MSSQVSRIFFSILADLNNTVVWIVTSRLPITNSLKIALIAPVTVKITITFMFHSFFSSLTRSKNFSVFPISLVFTLLSARTVKSTNRPQVTFILLTVTWSSRLTRIWWSLSQNPRELCASHFLGPILVCTFYQLVEWSSFNFLYNSQ